MSTRKQIPNKVVADLLLKSKRRCPFCYMEGDAAPKVGNIAHIEPVSRGGGDDADNLVFLCHQHHAGLDRQHGRSPTVPEIKAARDQLYEAISREAEGEKTTQPKVFIIHGHDETARQEVEQFLLSLDLVPVVLGEQPSFGTTIIEKIERNADADYAIAILSPTDRDCRARQNVILELGYFLGRLGRNRVCAIVTPGVEMPSDVHGMLYLEKDKHGRWQDALGRELSEAGLRLRSDQSRAQQDKSSVRGKPRR